MDKNTLSQYGWVVIVIIIIIILISLASPFGNFVADSAMSTLRSFREASSIDRLTDGSGGGAPGDTPEPTSTPKEELHEGAVIPEGCTYTQNGTVYTAGQNMPTPILDGDEFDDGEYIYKYNYAYDENTWRTLEQLAIFGDASGPALPPLELEEEPEEDPDIPVEITPPIEVTGWGVRVKNTSKTSYDSLYTLLNGENVVALSHTFAGCVNMTTAPKIPSCIKSLYYTFRGCTSLTGTVEINADFTIDYTTSYLWCFQDTVKPIKLTGSSPAADASLYTNNTNLSN